MKNGSFRTPFLSHKKRKRTAGKSAEKRKTGTNVFNTFSQKERMFSTPSTGFPQPKNPGKPHEYRGCGTFPHFQHLLLLILLPCYLLYITLLYIYFRPPKSVQARKGEPSPYPERRPPAAFRWDMIPQGGRFRTAEYPAQRTIPQGGRFHTTGPPARQGEPRQPDGVPAGIPRESPNGNPERQNENKCSILFMGTAL